MFIKLIQYRLKYCQMAELQEIMSQREDCSSLSAEASFTLEDILLEPDQIIQQMPQIMDKDQLDAMFDDEEDEQEEKEQEMVQIIAQKALQPKQIQQKQKEPQEQIEYSDVQKKPAQIVRERRLKDIALPNLQQIKNISFVPIKNVTGLFQNTQTRGVGIPTVIAIHASKLLAIGTSIGNIALFQTGVRGYKLLGTADHKKYGQVTALSISQNYKYMVSGQQNGMITVWSLQSYSEVKRQMAFACRVIKVLFCSSTQFIGNDIEGNTRIFTIQSFFWASNLRSQKLFQKSETIFHDMRMHKLQSKDQILAFCTYDSVVVIEWKTSTNINPIAKITRPDQLNYSKLPNVAMGKCFSQSEGIVDLVCVSWVNTIYVYILSSGRERLRLSYKFQVPGSVYLMEFISEGVLMIFDNLQTFRAFRVEADKGGKLLQTNQLGQQIVYQRNMRNRNGKHIHSFNNTVVVSSQSTQKQMFFIGRMCIYRCRMHRWNEVVSSLITNENKHKQALKICLQLKKGDLDIFVEPLQSSQKSLRILSEVGHRFISNQLKNIQQLNKNRVRNIDQVDQIRLVTPQLEEAFDCLIQFMVDIKATDYLFGKLYDDIFAYGGLSQSYSLKFMQCLSGFIQAGLINRFPNRLFFLKTTDYLARNKKKQIIQICIMSLDSSSIFYQDAIMICTDNKLYRALCYVSATHGDFISPLNKLLKAIKDAKTSKLQQSQVHYYMILKDCLIKLLGGCFVNGLPILTSEIQMQKSLATWLACTETFEFFTCQKHYQKDFFYFLEAILGNLGGQINGGKHVHDILRQFIGQSKKQQQMAQLFIKLSSVIALQPQQVKVILKNSTKNLIESQLTSFLQFVKLNRQMISEKDPQSINFVSLNPQLHYFYGIMKQIKTPMPENDQKLNFELTRYIFDNMAGFDIAQRIQQLLKLHSENTMVYMLQKFPVQIVDERLMAIADPQYRYWVIRKLLKKIRKGQISDKKRKSPLHLSLGDQSEKDTMSQRSGSQNTIIDNEVRSRRQLGRLVMQFYIQCLCKYKHQKRIYYEFLCYLSDYKDNIDRLVQIVTPYHKESCLGYLQETRGNLTVAFVYYEKVYRHYFFEQNYAKLLKIVHCHGRFMRRMFDQMLNITQIIDTQDQLMKLLTCVVTPLEEKPKGRAQVSETIQQVYLKKSNHPFLLQLASILEVCLQFVSRKVSINLISDFIGQHSRLFSKTFFLNSFRSALITYSLDTQISQFVCQMIKKDQVQSFDQIQHLKVKGIVPSLQQFQTNSQETAFHIYKCGHVFSQTQMKYYRQNQNLSEEQKAKNCRKCAIQQSGSDRKKQLNMLPDFNVSQQNIFYKGMAGFANIIPNMVSAIPNPISAFMSGGQKNEESLPTFQVGIASEDEVFDYVAMENNLQLRDRQLLDFVQQYKKYLDDY